MMVSEEILFVFFTLIISVLSSSILSDGLGAEYYAALLEELQGAHLRIAATNVSAKILICPAETIYDFRVLNSYPV